MGCRSAPGKWAFTCLPSIPSIIIKPTYFCSYLCSPLLTLTSLLTPPPPPVAAPSCLPRSGPGSVDAASLSKMNSMVVSLGTLAGCLDIANIGWVFGEWAGRVA